MQAGILTVKGCLGDEGQESESGELCLGAGAHSYQQEAQHDELLIYQLTRHMKTVSLRLVRRRKLIMNLERKHKIVLDVSVAHQNIRVKGW